MAIERTYNIPLRREWLRVPRHKRAKRAVKAIRNFLTQHMKSDEIKIGKYLNEAIWSRGIKSPPHHVQVAVTKDDTGMVSVELVGAPKTEKKETPAKATKEEKAPAAAPEAKPAAETKPVKAEKPVEKKEAKQEKPKAEKKTEQKRTEKKSSKK